MLTFTSCQADNTVTAGRAIAAYLADRLAMPVSFVADLPWQERLARLVQGHIDLGWVCGLYHARYDRTTLVRVAVPVNDGPRYRNRPIYFSDIIVRRDSAFRNLEDLRGCSWGYNEPGSYSGAVSPFYDLARRGETADFFGEIVETGAHVNSLRLVGDGEIDGAAIDSTVLAWESRRNPALTRQVRVIGTVGPNPAPPILASRGLDQDVREEVRRLLLGMAGTREGRAALAAGELVRMAPGRDEDYDQVRSAARAVEQAGFLKNVL